MPLAGLGMPRKSYTILSCSSTVVQFSTCTPNYLALQGQDTNSQGHRVLPRLQGHCSQV